MRLPGDKSVSHRILLFSLLAEGRGRVWNLSDCADVRSSAVAVEVLGGRVERRPEDGSTEIFGAGDRPIGGGKHVRVDCGNSGTTMRLLMGILAGADGSFILDGDGSLRRRPMERVAAPLRMMGASIRCTRGCCPVLVEGRRLRALRDYVTPVPSAQLKSAVLLAGLQADGPGGTRLTEDTETRDHTERLLEILGARIVREGRSCRIERGRMRMPPVLKVPGDPSSAAFLLCGAAIVPGSDVTAEGILLGPARTGFIDVLRRMGADVQVQLNGYFPEPHGSVRVRFSGVLAGCTVHPSRIPSMIDEIPILALVATQAEGVTRFPGVGELRVKECDRAGAVVSQLKLFGAWADMEGEDLVVRGPTRLRPPVAVRTFGDHRIAMTLAMAGMAAGADWVESLAAEDSIKVSYPGFRSDLALLSGG